jgi:hypothetical protein
MMLRFRPARPAPKNPWGNDLTAGFQPPEQLLDFRA